MVGHIGRAQLVGRLREHARDVQGDIARSHDRCGAGVQREAVDRRVGVTGVPRDEIGSREAAREVLAGDREPPVDRRAAGEQDGVIVAVQVLERDLGAHLHVAEEGTAGR